MMKFVRAMLVLSLGCASTSIAAAAQKKRQPPSLAPVTGTLTELTKAEKSDLGTLTVNLNGKTAQFVVDGTTRFETVRGRQHRPTSFLATTRGAKVTVVAAAGSQPPIALLVQILLPPAPPTPPKGPPVPRPVRGVVVAVGGGRLTLQLPQNKPVPPLVGTITDVSKDEGDGAGTLTLTVGGKPRTFVVNAATAFVLVQGGKSHPGSFLTEHRGERAAVFARPGATAVAARVDVLLAGSAVPLPAGHPHLPVTFLVIPATAVETVRSGKHHPSTQRILTVGEEVSVLPQAISSPIAAKVEVLLPAPVEGTVVSANRGAVTLRVAVRVKKGEPPQTRALTVPVGASTLFETIQGKAHRRASFAAVKPGLRLKAFPGAVPSAAAEIVEVHLRPAAKPPGHPKPPRHKPSPSKPPKPPKVSGGRR